MSCDAAAAAASILLASLSTPSQAPQAWQARFTPAAWTQVSATTNPLAAEPLYAEIVRRSAKLKAETDQFAADSGAGLNGARLDAFRDEVQTLSALDLQGHLDLAKRGTDGDLKCILKGISQDLPRKLAEVTTAATPETRKSALIEMAYLLRDNVEVITTPATVQSGT